jgi:hypothetical protein
MYLHDLIMGAGEGEKVWALNENLLDCRKSNLRKNSKELMERRRRDWDAHLQRQREQAARDAKRLREEQKERNKEDRRQADKHGFRFVGDYRAWMAQPIDPSKFKR